MTIRVDTMIHSMRSGSAVVIYTAKKSLLAVVLLVGIAWMHNVVAMTLLRHIQVQKLSHGRVALHLDFSKATLPKSRIFTTKQPPRIVVDLPDTINAVPTHIAMGVGATPRVTVVSAGKRTRVLIALLHPTSYQTTVEGHDLILTLGHAVAMGSLAARIGMDPSKIRPLLNQGPTVSNIDFRRLSHGAGEILVNFSAAGATVRLEKKKDLVEINFSHVKLPRSQVQRLNVVDFATPVHDITTLPKPGGARMQIRVHGAVDISSYQTKKQYAIQIVPQHAIKAVKKDKTGTQSTYKGRRVTFNFQNIPVRSALQLIADISGINLVASDSIKSNVTLRLMNVPWDQALDVILRAKGLAKRRDGNVIWVAPQQQLANYEQLAAKARISASDSAPLRISYIPINYGKASAIAKLLTTGGTKSTDAASGTDDNGAAHGFLSPRGSVSFDQRTNTLLLSETAKKTQEVRALIAKLDKPVRQVLIESRIVIATDDFKRELGVRWGANGSKRKRSGQTINIGGPLSGSSSKPGGFNVNLPLTSPAGSLGISILGKRYALDLELAAAQTEGRSELISSPRVITANQQQADIKQGQQIGYVTYQNSGSGGATASVNFKDAVLELKVRPTITADNRVYLEINVKKDALAKMVVTPNGDVPLIDTRSVNTSALVDNGQTVVLGGIYEINKNHIVNKVPGLGDMPILGGLFRKTTKLNSRAELLIFVTPHILQ